MSATSFARCLTVALGLSTFAVAQNAEAPTGPYSNDLSKMEPGKPPEELFILNGDFQVADDDGNRILRLAGSPVDSFGVLFGSGDLSAVEVSAKIRGTRTGMLFPEFGIGANDSSGFKLWVMPGQNALAIRRKEVDELARVPFEWTSGQWTQLKLRVSKAGDGKWVIEGKAWAAEQKEPEKWMVTVSDSTDPSPGRASIWGHPYADTPIDFDDLSSTPK